MFFSSHKHSKKDKKTLQRERNKRNWIIFMQCSVMLAQVQIAAPDGSKRPLKGAMKRLKGKGAKGKKESKQSSTEWQNQLKDVRSKLHARKNTAQDRWNRFAGTSDGGGRGR